MYFHTLCEAGHGIFITEASAILKYFNVHKAISKTVNKYFPVRTHTE